MSIIAGIQFPFCTSFIFLSLLLIVWGDILTWIDAEQVGAEVVIEKEQIWYIILNLSHNWLNKSFSLLVLCMLIISVVVQ